MRLTVIVPIFNESPSLVVLFEQLEKIDREDFTIHFIDNGSEDPRVIELLSNQKSKHISFERLASNAGFGGAIAHGIRGCTSDYVGWMPGNLKVSVQDALYVFDALLSSNGDCAKARRIRKGLVSKLKTLFAGALFSAVFQRNLMDSGGTPTVIKTRLISPFLEFSPTGVDFEAFISYLIARQGFRVIRPKVKYMNRVFGKSHWQSGFGAELRLVYRIIRERRTWSRII